ncbi:PilN domain-containing protein [Neobacillus sp. LXY-1]|uniref:PilN domain-containing protein n=1 Tax=Neobacillus sp. LXY-1 TaxID=3379133 RepID=UPI003EE36E2E
MFIEINLLPQREPKKVGFIIAISSLVFLLILSGAYYLGQVHSVKNDITRITRQIDITSKVVNKDNNQSGISTSSKSISQLNSAIDWAKEYPIQTVPVLRHLSSLLPERGFIQSFGYTEAGTITLTVQFDTSREAAYFLETLHDSKWIEDASLNALTATDQSKTTGTSSTSTNPPNTSTATTVQGSTVSTNSQTNTAGQNTTTQATGGIQVAPGTTLVDQNGNVYTIVDHSNTNSANTTDSTNTTNSTTNKTSTTTKSSILPRYTGQFEIKLNQTVVKEEIKKSEDSEEGGTG